MIPLTMAPEGKPVIITKINGKDETRRQLENMGFAIGGTATVVATVEGSMIINVKEARIAVGREMANRIMVDMD